MSVWRVDGYTEIRDLGAGGGGRVVQARDDRSGADVAIKYLHGDLTDSPGFTDALRREAAILAGLDDPHIVRLYEYVETPQGSAIVMELVEGVSLRAMLRRHGATEPETALLILKGSLLGLAAAHEHGIVHRDYKPENVLVDGSGTSKLADFGIAARAGDRPAPAGTLRYMAPEAFARGGVATPATDVYAATVTFHECLTGHPPFVGHSWDELRAQHTTEPVPLQDVPRLMQPLVSAGMAKDPRDRPATATEFLATLEAVATGAYGTEWERRGHEWLAAGALLLAAFWPSGPAIPRSVPGRQGAGHGSSGAQQGASSQQAGHASSTQPAQPGPTHPAAHSGPAHPGPVHPAPQVRPTHPGHPSSHRRWRPHRRHPSQPTKRYHRLRRLRHTSTAFPGKVALLLGIIVATIVAVVAALATGNAITPTEHVQQVAGQHTDTAGSSVGSNPVASSEQPEPPTGPIAIGPTSDVTIAPVVGPPSTSSGTTVSTSTGSSPTSVPVSQPPPSTPTQAPAPTLSPAVSVNPASGNAPLAVTVDARASTATGQSITGYRFDFGDGRITAVVSSPTVNNTYDIPGTYRVTVTVTTDTGQSGSASASVTVNAAPLPSVSAHVSAGTIRMLGNCAPSLYPTFSGTIGSSLTADVMYHWHHINVDNGTTADSPDAVVHVSGGSSVSVPSDGYFSARAGNPMDVSDQLVVTAPVSAQSSVVNVPVICIDANVQHPTCGPTSVAVEITMSEPTNWAGGGATQTFRRVVAVDAGGSPGSTVAVSPSETHLWPSGTYSLNPYSVSLPPGYYIATAQVQSQDHSNIWIDVGWDSFSC